MAWLDFKLGVRLLSRYPGLTVVGGLAMAFAIWVGAGSFELINQWINPSLPLPEGERVIGIQNWDAGSRQANGRSLHDYVQWRTASASVDDLSAFRGVTRNLTDIQGNTEPIKIAEISASAFRVARVPALLGRFLLDSDETSNTPVVVIGYAIWQTRFGGDPNVVGRTVRIGNTDSTVVGVMPESFAFPISYDAWLPFRLNVLNYERGRSPEIYVLGRLASGVSIAEAQAEYASLGQRAAIGFPDTNQHLRPRVLPFAESVSPVPTSELYAMRLINLFVAMLVVLVCGNVGLLMFARAATRESEIVVRNALGASRKRIIVQLFSEALVLCGIGAVVGLAAARYGVRWGMFIIESNVGRLPFWVDDRLSWTTLLYTVGLTLLGAIIAGVVPALKVTRNVGAHLQQTSAGAGGGVKFSGVWTVVIVAQVAVTVVFPVSVLFIRRTEGPIRSLDVGFASEQYLSARLEVEGPADASRIYRELDRRLSAEGVVEGVTFADRLPRMFHDSRHIEAIDDAAIPADSQGRVVSSASVAVDYMDVLGAEMLAGRRFNEADAESGRRVIIVNKSFVNRVLNGRNAIGRHVRFTNARESSFEIVGVVEDLGMNYLGKEGAEGVYYALPTQRGQSDYLVVKIRGDAASFTPRLRAVANAVEPTLKLYNLQPMNEMNNGIFKILAIFITVAVVVSSVALLLSLAGIYAVMSFSVSRRTREIGVRVALGANSRSVVFAIFRRPLAQVGLGVAIGGILVALFARTAFGELSTREIGFVIAYAALMMVVCLLACIVPTRRALHVQPTQALRADG